MHKLTQKQERIIKYIQKTIDEKSLPPTLREICSALGYSSPSSAHAQIKKLTEMGYIEKDNALSRGIKLCPEYLQKGIPLLGTVQAGVPTYAEENILGYIPFEKEYSPDEHFALKVEGLSMIDAGILDGDILIVQRRSAAENGDIVVAIFDDEATVKRYKYDGRQVWLMPANKNFRQIDGRNALILGKVKAVIRKYI